MVNLRTRLTQLEKSKLGDPYAELDPELWPLVGSQYTHEEWVDILEREERVGNEP